MKTTSFWCLVFSILVQFKAILSKSTSGKCQVMKGIYYGISTAQSQLFLPINHTMNFLKHNKIRCGHHTDPQLYILGIKP